MYIELSYCQNTGDQHGTNKSILSAMQHNKIIVCTQSQKISLGAVANVLIFRLSVTIKLNSYGKQYFSSGEKKRVIYLGVARAFPYSILTLYISTFTYLKQFILLYVHSSIAIILMGKRELVALLNLSSWCLVMVEWLFLAVPWGCLRFVIVVFPDQTHLLFFNEINVRKCYIHVAGRGTDILSGGLKYCQTVL